MSGRLAFHLPAELAADRPPEARGIPRDGVRMMVAHRGSVKVDHRRFADLPDLLDPRDLVVVNTSATIPGAVDGRGDDGAQVIVHLSTRLGDRRWVVEPRRATREGTVRWRGEPPPTTIHLPADGVARLEGPHLGSDRLWVATLEVPGDPLGWLAAHGRPIRYGYVEDPWPLSAYQNVYAREPGSAEMASAGRPFTADVITRLVSKGVGITPVVLHTGVASLEADEWPYPEHAHVPAVTAARVRAARRAGGRVVAVGTTTVRALESAVDPEGCVRPFDGWTDVVVTPERGVRAVDGLLTGWHEPEASHLLMLEAIAGRELLERSYAAAIEQRYLWHEFGDVHLILP